MPKVIQMIALIIIALTGLCVTHYIVTGIYKEYVRHSVLLSLQDTVDTLIALKEHGCDTSNAKLVALERHSASLEIELKQLDGIRC